MPWLFGAEVLRPNAGPRRAGCVSDVRRGVRVARSGRSQDRKARLDEEPRREVVLIETSETMTQKFLVLVASAVLLWTPRGAAQERTPASLVVTAQNVTAETAGRMNKTVAQPGDEIRYRLVFTNVTAGPVKNVQFVDPIPSGMVYTLGSATSDQRVRVEYSIDSAGCTAPGRRSAWWKAGSPCRSPLRRSATRTSAGRSWGLWQIGRAHV